jgi:hypothetical protein
MNNNDSTRRPHYLRQEPTVLGSATGLAIFSTYATFLTPVIWVLSGIKTVFDSATKSDLSDPGNSNDPVKKTTVSDWELKNVVLPMIKISHINIDWSEGTVPKTVLFNTHSLNLLHARAELVSIDSSSPDKNKKIASLYMSYFTRDGVKKERGNIVDITTQGNKPS